MKDKGLFIQKRLEEDKYIVDVCNEHKEVILKVLGEGKLKIGKYSDMFLLSNEQYWFIQEILVTNKIKLNEHYSLNKLIKK